MWDFDGVLFHSSALFFNILKQKLYTENMHHIESKISSWDSLLGLNTHELAVRLLKDVPGIDLQRFENELIAKYKDAAIKQLSLDERGVEIVKRQMQLSVVQCIVSNGYPDLIFRQVLKANIANAFSQIVTPTELLEPKPSTDMYSFLLNKIDLSESECVVVEDSDLGEVAAKLAGLSVVKVVLNETSAYT
jgi:beta-phosphoglucomutase-like phosphatase (HAD superfamily)